MKKYPRMKVFQIIYTALFISEIFASRTQKNKADQVTGMEAYQANTVIQSKRKKDSIKNIRNAIKKIINSDPYADDANESNLSIHKLIEIVNNFVSKPIHKSRRTR
jgi:hypothetical protein